MQLYSEVDSHDFLKRKRINEWPRLVRERESRVKDLGNKLNVNVIIRSRVADEYLKSKGYQCRNYDIGKRY